MAPSVPSFRQDKLPYRVVDVDATLSSKGRFIFCQADSISDFCVISHRWTDHVTRLMEEISSTAKQSKLRYPQAVTEKNWADVEATREAYQSINNFLEILQAQGVKKVWMDMLCIDQSKDSTEMSREILLMGPYYRHSSACYVSIKGFGLDYKLKMGEDVTKYMSWLNRVWTLQEFLLPEKLYFLIELEEWMEEWLARRVASAGEDLSHFCTCCLGRFMMEDLQKMSEKMKGVVLQLEKIREADINQSCGHCKSPPLLRKANKAQDCRLYLIQREAILVVACLAQFHKRVQDNDWEETEDQWKERNHEAFALLGRKEFLHHAMSERGRGAWFNTFYILSEVCKRECSEEPDRVSGVLGLLGVNTDTNNPQEQQGVAQVSREVKTAEDQLVKLASTGAFTEHLLVLLCGMNSHSGRFKPQMSWIPNLTYRGPDEDLLNCLPNEFKSLATNVRVSRDGPITLTVKVLKGYVTYHQDKSPMYLQWTARFSEEAQKMRRRRRYGLRFHHASRHFREFEDDMYVYRNQFPQKEVQRFNQEHKDVSDPKDKRFIDPKDRSFGGPDGTLELTFDEYGSFILPLNELTWLELYGFEMWLLYLGHADTCKGTVLLCLHKRGTENVVHKIGTLDATYLGARKVLDDLDDPPEEITIAGYGKYLDECVDMEK